MAERMLETSPVPEVVDVFVTRLRNRSNLGGVGIWSAPADTTGEGEYLMVIDCNEDVEPIAAGRERNEHVMTLTCGVLVARPGSGDEVAAEIRRRAGEILGEVEREMRTVAGNAMVNADDARVVRFTTVPQRIWEQGFTKGARWCSIEFSVRAKATTTRV